MSYASYTGTVSARGGKGKEAPQCHADISAVIPTGLSSAELIEIMETKYGCDVVASLIWNAYKVVIQKAGQAVLKDNPDNIEKAAQAIVDRANSDLSPQRRSAAPKVTMSQFKEALEASGVSAKKIEETLAALLDS